MSFKQIVGQDRQINILKNAVKRGTVAHAYLFTGIPGIGKRSTAIAMAKALNCKTTTGDFCSSCTSCKKIEHTTHPDIHWIEPEGDYIKIDQIRRMQEQISYTLYEGKHKVVILNKIERLNPQSSNCLLKTLEEPPPHTTLILLTSAPYQVLSTLRSRCQRLMFQPLPIELIAKLLQKKGRDENDKLNLIASLAGGSLGKAIQWMEAGALQEREELFEKINHLNKCFITEIFDLAASLGEDKAGLLKRLELLKLWIRDLLIFKATDQSRYLINRDLVKKVTTLASQLSWSNLFKKAAIVDEVQSALLSNVNPRLAMETMLLKFYQ
jgi:DNA polymerase-3 subunit delta'